MVDDRWPDDAVIPDRETGRAMLEGILPLFLKNPANHELIGLYKRYGLTDAEILPPVEWEDEEKPPPE